MKAIRTTLLGLAILTLAPSARAQHQIQLPTLAGGGGWVTATTHALWFTIGLPVSGSVVATDHAIVAGLWSGLDATVTAVEPDVPSNQPTADRLSPNVPNPFNPMTVVDFELARSGRVTLRVFDVAGRRLATLVDGNLAGGRHSVRWSGRDDTGSPVASGIYLIVMETSKSRFTQKAVLLR